MRDVVTDIFLVLSQGLVPDGGWPFCDFGVKALYTCHVDPCVVAGCDTLAKVVHVGVAWCLLSVSIAHRRRINLTIRQIKLHSFRCGLPLSDHTLLSHPGRQIGQLLIYFGFLTVEVFHLF